MKCVVFYETAAEGLAKARGVYPDHKARIAAPESSERPASIEGDHGVE